MQIVNNIYKFNKFSLLLWKNTLMSVSVMVVTKYLFIYITIMCPHSQPAHLLIK